ncbi:hypothetical protein [Pseudomonas kilonensis]|nr:hypothetical protein [Pseudomonas kilonensis]
MFKATPNPPESDPSSSYSSLDPEKFHEATERSILKVLSDMLRWVSSK